TLVAAEAREAVASQPPAAETITARGRLEPKDGVTRVAGPSQPTIFMNVISELYVKEGDAVEAGQIIGVFDSHASKSAAVARLKAELEHVQREYQRFERLYKQ